MRTQKQSLALAGLLAVVAMLAVGIVWTATAGAAAVPADDTGQCSPGQSPGAPGTGRARGEVLTAEGLPGAGLFVDLLLPDGHLVRRARTDAGGHYVFFDLPVGRFHVQVLDEQQRPLPLETKAGLDVPPPGQGSAWIEQVLVLAPPAGDALPPAGAPALGGETLLAATISGRVTAADGGTPPDAFVAAFASTTADWGDWAATDWTDALGDYALTGLAGGTYYVGFITYDPNYLDEYYNDKPALAAADGIPVPADGTVANIDAALNRAARITGRVTAATGGAPIEDVFVAAFTSTTGPIWDYVAYTWTNASGLYTITKLAGGTYFLHFDPPSASEYLEEFYDDKPTLAAADPVDVAPGSIVPNINAALRTAGRITGQVTAAGSGTPLDDVGVTVYDIGCGWYQSVAWASTNASGMYTVTGLLPGRYRVGFDPYSSGASAAYLPEYYNDRADLDQGDPVVVAEGGTTGGINAALALGGQISGRVTAADGGAPLDDVWVSAGSNFGFGSGSTDATGAYVIAGLPPGDFRVEFEPFTGGAAAVYVGEYYNDKTTWATADPVSVTSGGVAGNVDAALARGGRIRGQVTGADGRAPLQSVSVTVLTSSGSWAGSAQTNASGVYTTSGLVTGSYRVRFRTQSVAGVTGDYMDEYYDDKATLQTADPVSVTAPDLTSGIDAVLARGGRISGRVTAAGSGAPVYSIEVSAYDSTGREVRYDYTDAAGNYSITGLPGGTYRLYFSGRCNWEYVEPRFSQWYFGEYYDDRPDLATATIVSVTGSGTVSAVDAVLVGGVFNHWAYLPLVLRQTVAR